MSPPNPPNDVIIRPATMGDAAVAYAFICALEETPIDQTAFRQIYQSNIASPPVHYFVADKAGEVVGFISCHTQHLLHHGGKVGEIQELFVRQDMRGQGVGGKLLAEVTALALREEFVNLEVTTNQKRQDTIRFYERESFRLSHVKLVKSINP
jgi:PhnO protein